jgi:hypothetical protein
MGLPQREKRESKSKYRTINTLLGLKRQSGSFFSGKSCGLLVIGKWLIENS